MTPAVIADITLFNSGSAQTLTLFNTGSAQTLPRTSHNVKAGNLRLHTENMSSFIIRFKNYVIFKTNIYLNCNMILIPRHSFTIDLCFTIVHKMEHIAIHANVRIYFHNYIYMQDLKYCATFLLTQ